MWTFVFGFDSMMSQSFSDNKAVKSSSILRFNYMSGETLLNKETYDIEKYIKKQMPKSTIAILSNGTIPPPKGKVDIVKFHELPGLIRLASEIGRY